MKKRIWFAIVFALLVALGFIVAIGPVLSGPLRAARPETNVKHGVPALAPGTSAMHFSNDPTDEEFRRVGLFVQPLIPSGRTTREENRDLADALCAYASAIRNGSQDSVAPILDYLDTHPKSAWRAVLQLELGAIYRRTGHFSKALDVWQACWNNSKTLTTPNGRKVGDMAVGYLSQFEAYLGRKEALAPLLEEARKRPIRGSATELVSESASGLADMTTMPDMAFKCGPSALARILAIQTSPPSARSRGVLERARSTPNGLSLSAVQRMSVEAGMNYQMAYRPEGAPVILPAVVHWKVGHFAALLGKNADARYRIGDATFGEDIVISSSTLEEEASGYFLLPPGRLPNGWRSVSASEGDRVWGRGDTGSNHDTGATGPNELHAFGCGGGGGCSTWNVEAMVDGLSLHDDPVGYTPPIGPPVRFPMDYSQRDMLQPMTFTYTNFGNKWTTEWLSYVTENAGCAGFHGSEAMGTIIPGGTVVGQSPNPDCALLYRRGGGTEPYLISEAAPYRKGPKGLMAVDSTLGQFSQGVLTKLVDPMHNNAVVGFWRTLPDGSIEKFELQMAESFTLYETGTVTFFMTEVDDPQGNAVKISYDNLQRIVALTDALGQVTTVCYNDSWQSSNLCAQPPAATNPPSNLQVTQVRDPFGRSAFFGYDPVQLAESGTGHLTSITDVMGITSTFTYADHDFISSLATPYGVTKFAYTDMNNDNTAGSSRSVTIVDPLGRTSRVEFRQGDPDGNCTSTGATGDAATVESHFITCAEQTTPSGMPVAVRNSLLQFRNTFIWDPFEYQAAFGNGASPSAVYSSAKLIHWLHTNETDTNQLTASRIPESTKLPLEHRTWLEYENQNDNGFASSPFYQSPTIGVGSTDQPIAVGKVLDNGSTQLWTFKYNPYGKIMQATDPIGRQLTMAYDTNGIDLLTVTNTTTVNGTPLKDLLVTYANYNSEHESQKVVATNGFATTFSYNAAGQLTGSTDPLGKTWSYSYTPNGHIQQITGPAGPQVPKYSFTFDSSGRINQATDAAGGTLTYSYDQADRLTGIAFPDQTSERFAYTLLDLASVTDRQQNSTVRHYDADREVTEIDEPSGRNSMLTYALNGTVQTMQDPGGFTTTWTRDLEGRATAVKYADSTSVSYTYDGNNRITAIERIPVGPLVPGVMVQYTYNLDNTPSEIAPVPAKRGEIAPQVDVLPTFFFYDPAYRRLTGWLQASEKPNGNPTINSSENIGYFPATSGLGANRVSVIQDESFDSAGKGYIFSTVTYAYDELDRVASQLVIPNFTGLPGDMRYQETWSYDALGRVVSDKNTLDGFNYFYSDATPRVTSRASGGMSVGFSYYGPKGDELLQEMAYVTPIALPFADYKYKYDSNRNVTHFDEFTLTGGLSSTAHTYDPYNQLLSASPPGGQIGGSVANNYTYDANGNLISQSIFAFGLPYSRTETTYSNTNAMVTTSTQPLFGLPTGSTASYDVSANLTAINGITYKYDRLNRLVEARQGNNVSDFYYDGVGRLVQVIDSTGGKTVRNRSYGWCGGARCVEYDNTNQVPLRGGGTQPFADKLYFGQGMMNFSSGNGFPTGLYYIADALGNVRGLAHSAAGIPYVDPTVTRYTYSPYGGRAKALGGPDADFGFAGYFHHEATGLEFTANRVYNPQLQRWMTRDPLGTGIAFAGGAGFNATDSNMYVYAGNNPTSAADPSGLCPQCVVAGAGALVGGIGYGIYYAFTAPTSLSWGQFAEGASSAILQGALVGALAAAGAGLAAEVGPWALGVLAGGTAAGGEAGESCEAALVNARQLGVEPPAGTTPWFNAGLGDLAAERAGGQTYGQAVNNLVSGIDPFGSTINQTWGGAYGNAISAPTPFWQGLSADYAAEAGLLGQAKVLIGDPSPTSIWVQTERPILEFFGVQIQYFRVH